MGSSHKNKSSVQIIHHHVTEKLNVLAALFCTMNVNSKLILFKYSMFVCVLAGCFSDMNDN